MSKTILITGASRGIGAATARLAGARGWAVGVNYAGNAEAAAATVKAVEAAGGKAIAIKGDVAEEADVIAMFDATEAAFGKLDGVVVNAGILDVAAQLADMPVERLRKVFDVNILGAALTAREAARRLSTGRGGNGGSVVVVSSAAARLGGADERIDYALSKGAMDTMAIGMSKELGPEGIRVNSIRPGLIVTDIHASGGQPERANTLGGGTPLRRAGTAEEVGEAIVWLLDDASSYVTGALLDVTGGR
ncbi:SDR family oxidoreductase [Microbaculum marinum]|uniref:SDR family oxidoreductase n=1 Tax=Microbaculum marinum TaxID=1764581 RepID=A0AAW9RWR7_9HYPH